MKTYYIDPIAGIDTNSGRSFTSAFKTWKKAASVAQSTDIIKLGAGIYDEQLNINAQLITVEAYGNGEVVFSGNNILPTGIKFNDNIILPNNEISTGYTLSALCNITANFITLRNIIIENSTGRGIEIANANHITLTNVTTRNTKAEGIVVSNCQNVAFNNVKVTEASAYAKSWRDAKLAKFMSGILIINSTAILFNTVNVSNVYGAGIEFKNVTDVESYAVSTYDNYTGISLYGCSNLVLDQFFAYQYNPFFIGKGNGGINFLNNNTEIGIFNAIIANHTINLNVSAPAELVNINNCTIYNTKINQLLIRIATAQTDFIIQNSIIYGEDSTIDFSADYLDTASGYDSNLWFGVVAPLELESVNDITDDPEFVNKTIITDLNNYKLLSTSPAINASNGNAQFGDYLSNSPISQRDLGAIEFIVGTVPLVNPIDDNMLLNSEFDVDETDWIILSDYIVDAGVLRVTATSLNTIAQEGISLVSGDYYELSFDVAGSPIASPIKIEIIDPSSNNLGLNEILSVSDAMTTYKFKFQCNATEANASLVFSFNGEYYFDNIYLYPSEPLVIADFSISNINPSLGEVVYFNNNSITTNAITSIEWDFGGISTETVDDTSTLFILPGPVDISLTITTTDGTDTITKQIQVKSTLNPFIIVSHTKAKVGELIGFGNISSILVPVDSYLWDFDDGMKATTADAVHSYSQPGTYKVTLTTTNEGGSTTSAEHIIEITEYEIELPDVTMELMAVDPITGSFLRIQPPPNINYTLVSIESGGYQWMPYKGQ